MNAILRVALALAVASALSGCSFTNALTGGGGGGNQMAGGGGDGDGSGSGSGGGGSGGDGSGSGGSGGGGSGGDGSGSGGSGGDGSGSGGSGGSGSGGGGSGSADGSDGERTFVGVAFNADIEGDVEQASVTRFKLNDVTDKTTAKITHTENPAQASVSIVSGGTYRGGGSVATPQDVPLVEANTYDIPQGTSLTMVPGGRSETYSDNGVSFATHGDLNTDTFFASAGQATNVVQGSAAATSHVVNGIGGNVTPKQNLSATATYIGGVGGAAFKVDGDGNVEDAGALTGVLNMSADFNANKVSGKADQVHYKSNAEAGQPGQGTPTGFDIRFNDATIQSDSTFAGTMTAVGPGTNSAVGTSSNTAYAGAFYGSSGQQVGGGMVGEFGVGGTNYATYGTFKGQKLELPPIEIPGGLPGFP